jgi:hypothetical protein
MFHATGDPEWLYNIAGRPLFNLPGALLFALGVGIALWRWRQPRAALLFLWLALGLAPACVSIPAASLSHTIAAQPAVYLLVAGATFDVASWVRTRAAAMRATWARRDHSLAMQRGIGDHLGHECRSRSPRLLRRLATAGSGALSLPRRHPRCGAVLCSTPRDSRCRCGKHTVSGRGTGVALEVDSGRPDLRARFFNPQRALVWLADSPSRALLTFYPLPEPPIADWLAVDAGSCTYLAGLLRAVVSPARSGGAGRGDGGLGAARARAAGALRQRLGAAWGVRPGPGRG